jgi:hypothetical protein
MVPGHSRRNAPIVLVRAECPPRVTVMSSSGRPSVVAVTRPVKTTGAGVGAGIVGEDSGIAIDDAREGADGDPPHAIEKTTSNPIGSLANAGKYSRTCISTAFFVTVRLLVRGRFTGRYGTLDVPVVR